MNSHWVQRSGHNWGRLGGGSEGGKSYNCVTGREKIIGNDNPVYHRWRFSYFSIYLLLTKKIRHCAKAWRIQRSLETVPRGTQSRRARRSYNKINYYVT